MISRRRKDASCASPTLLGVFTQTQSGHVCARVFQQFVNIADARNVAPRVPAIARKARTTEDDVWYLLYCYLLGFRKAPQG